MIKVAVLPLYPLAVAYHWCNDILTDFLSREQTGDELMVRGQDCWVGVAALSIQNL